MPHQVVWEVRTLGLSEPLVGGTLITTIIWEEGTSCATPSCLGGQDTGTQRTFFARKSHIFSVNVDCFNKIY